MKKITLILSIALLFSFAYFSVSADTVHYKGDIDIDGNINATDALMVLKHAAKIEEVDTLIADVDEDKAVNATDALWILKYAAKIVSEFPGGNIVKTEGTDTTPEPTETASPVPTETVSPVPTETISPAPTETVSPMPSETVSPTPTITPTPTLSPIESIKEYVTSNGFNGENGEKIYGYSYEDNTVKASIKYVPAEDRLVFALDYEEITDSETMLVSVEMSYLNSFDFITLEAGYEYGDFKQNYKAKAPIVPAEITAESTYAFTEISSVNCSDDEINAILSMGDMYTETALYLWNSILTEDMNISLSDIGFTKYTQ